MLSGEYERQMCDKDKQIRILEEKCAIYKRAQGYGSEQVQELEKKCHKLQNQVHCMESFLEDYGMIWVGNPNSSDEEYDEEEDEDDRDEEAVGFAEKGGGCGIGMGSSIGGGDEKLWSPQAALSTPPKQQQQQQQQRRTFKMDFDLVLKNIKELNSISGEGEHYIKHTKDGARLQVKEPVPLKLYKNGIFMFGGPFRPYEDRETQSCVEDLMEGFFPSELQTSYPDGVPFNVEDKRNVCFRDKRLELEVLFPGKGQVLSPEKRKGSDDDGFGDGAGGDPFMRSVGTATTHTVSDDTTTRTETIDDVTHRQSVERFLSRLPPSVMKNGKIIDIRDGVKENLSSTTKKNEVIVADTEVMRDIQERVNSGTKSRPTTASAVTTLRVKSPQGDRTYMLKMRYTDTVGQVKRQLEKVMDVRTCSLDSCVLKTSFPSATYTDLNMTLKECGLVPNATLHIVNNAIPKV